MKTQKELKKEYLEKLKKNPANAGMMDYYKSDAFYIAELTDKTLLVISKPSLETEFWFDDSFDYDGARDRAKDAKTNTDYFIDYNMRTLKDNLKVYENMKKAREAGDLYGSKFVALRDTNKEGVTAIRFKDSTEPLGANDIVVSDDDLDIIIKSFKEALKKQEKRINTYLKRYGLSKVKARTYWGMK